MARLESVRSEHAIAMLQGRGPALYAENLDRYPPLFLVEGMEEIQISYKHTAGSVSILHRNLGKKSCYVLEART